MDRVALEIITALAQRPEVERLIILHPPVALQQTEWLDRLDPSGRARIELRSLGHGTGHSWEQTFLSRAEIDLTLVSFCGTGPVLRPRHAVFLHDAQVWDVPASYSLPFRLAYRTLLPALARQAQLLFTVSAHARGRLETHRIAPTGKAQVIHNGADHMLRIAPDDEALARNGLRQHGYILAIGSLAAHKNLDLLIASAERRPAGSPPLVVAGGGNARVFSPLELPEGSTVRQLGRVTDGELKALYQGALALAFPSLTEGFGLPPVEAMLLGCPVVATTGGAVPEVCGDAALYADPRQAEDWTAALDRIATDEALRARLRQRGAARAARYTWSSGAEALTRALEAISR